ncbi:MAG TPA: response regulator [Stellaceae bacterium]|jgi:two-component system NtrC family sensor kinase|nr:response regulator [Stellaceae bacterium]
MTQRVPAILVLEDEEEVRKTISATLSDAGFQVETAVTGWEAIALIELRRFDMVVAGINLPGGLTGLQTARHVRTRHPALKCLFISGSADPVVCDPELDDFVAKPFRPFELLGCVWKVLRGNLPNPRINVASLA